MHTTVMGESKSERYEVKHIFHQNISDVLIKTLLTLGNQSMVNLFVNPKHLPKIRIVSRQWMSFAMQAVHLQINAVPAEIANIISLKTVQKLFRVIHESNDRERVFRMHGLLKFLPHPKKGHYLDLAKRNKVDIILTMRARCKY